MKFDNRFFKHIYRFLSGENDSNGKSIVDRWYDSFDDSTGYFGENKSLEKEERRERIFRNIEEGLKKRKHSKEKVTKERGNPILLPYFRLAAILAIGILFSVVVIKWPLSSAFEKKDVNLTTITSETGEVLEIELQDGSRVWLSAESSIQYPDKFKGDERVIHLEGEAFFDVNHNPEKPFIIYSREVKSRVLGTSFTVKSYSDEPTKVTLSTGKVSVSAIGDKQEVVLTENQQVSYVKEIGFSDISNVDASLEHAWRNKELIFIRESFQDIARTFERWYDVEFIFEDASLKEEVFVYHFTEYSLEQSLEILNRMANFSYEIEDTHVIIDSKK